MHLAGMTAGVIRLLIDLQQALSIATCNYVIRVPLKCPQSALRVPGCVLSQRLKLAPLRPPFNLSPATHAYLCPKAEPKVSFAVFILRFDLDDALILEGGQDHDAKTIGI